MLGRLLQSWNAGAPFTVTGTDWPTRDGSGLRDFVHVRDLARAHVSAVLRFDDIVHDVNPHLVLNVGAGRGTTVKELVAAFERVVRQRLDVQEAPRRPGDSAGGFALVGPAHEALEWAPEFTVERGIRDAIAWQRRVLARPS